MPADPVAVQPCGGGWWLDLGGVAIARFCDRDGAERAAAAVRGLVADTREACARVAEAHGTKAEARRAVAGDRRDWDETSTQEGAADAAHAIARDIRALAAGAAAEEG
jgi:hypothetical protein